MATNNKDFKVKNGLSVAGSGVFGGTVTIDDPTESNHAATKLYVDQNAGGTVDVSDTPPSSPIQGEQWYNSANGATYIYYDGFWVETSTGAEASALDAASPLAYDAQNSIMSIDLTFFEDHKVMAIMGAI